MHFEFEEYLEKVTGCYIGKSVGGTLGMKYEGDINTHNVTFYDPVPTQPLPNDDLDLQIVNLENLLRSGLPVCRYNIGDMWRYNIDECAPDEYGVAVSNHALKLNAPLSGQFRNKFYAGMGGAIRSELWACLAPANPSLAARLAREDACTDHTADGLFAEMFLAAAESAAFIEKDLKKLVKTGLAFVPQGSRLRSAFDDVIKWWNEVNDISVIRERILGKYYSDNWTDVTINLSFILLSLISCGGSFDKAICTAVSLGYDTDCTAATVGSIFGIMNPSGIDKKWTTPIGNKLILSDCIVNMHEPETINEFCGKLISVAYEIQKYYKTDVTISSPPSGFKYTKIARPWTKNATAVYNWDEHSKEALIMTSPVMISLCYPENFAAKPEKETSYSLRLHNNSEALISGDLAIQAPDGWEVKEALHKIRLSPGEECVLPFSLNVPHLKRRALLNILRIDIETEGLSFSCEAGIPLTNPWLVTDLNKNDSFVFEAPDIYFNVPKGSYSYKTYIKSSVDRAVRISASGTRAFKLLVNGKEVFSGDGSFYVPTFHRDDSWTETNVNINENEIEVIFPDGDEGEFFFGFGTTYSCALWINSMERYVKPQL